MTTKPDPPVLERHRRMAAESWYEGRPDWPRGVKHWVETGDGEDKVSVVMVHRARLIATVERDAFARGVEATLDEIERRWMEDQGGVDFEPTERETLQALRNSIRALLHESPRTGPELAAEHGFPNLAESGAARVPAVVESPPDPACACMDEENSGGAVRTETRDCPVHGNPETASSEAFEQAARICEQTMPPGFRAMSQDWRDGYLVCQREVARAIRERGGK